MSHVVGQNGSNAVYLELNGNWYWFDLMSQPIGCGATSTVFKGFHYFSGEAVAIKMISPRYACIPEVRSRILNEASMVFVHPNIVRIFGVCESRSIPGALFLISEWVSGSTLDRFCSEYLSDKSPDYTVATVLYYMIGVLEALSYMHSCGVVHRDIKPSNIMISQSGVAKILDMGIAIGQTSGVASPLVDDGFIGTSLYAAPELAAQEMVDGRADLYAVAITIYEMISGFNPFDSASMHETLYNQKYFELPRNFRIPDELYSILSIAASKDRDYRYSDAAEFAYELKTFLTRYNV